MQAEIYGAGTTRDPTPEYPDEAQLRAYGDFSFLYLRSPKHAPYPMAEMRRHIQPPIDLRLFRVMRVEGVPRAGITWAFLSEAAEEKLRDQRPIQPSDWVSGPYLWIMEVIAPYEGDLGARMVRGFLDGLSGDRRDVRFPRFHRDRPGLKHFVEWYRDGRDFWRSRRLRPADLAGGTRPAAVH